MNDNPMHPAQRLQDAPSCTDIAKSTRTTCHRPLLSTDGPFAACTARGALLPQARGMESGAVAAGHVKLLLSVG